MTGSPTWAEYKQVTVLFADVVHSMDIAAAVGAERLREIMSGLFVRSSAVVQRYGGTVDKFTGDGIMAFFGAPKAQPDHAIRAVRAAMNMQSRMAPLLARWQKESRSFAEATRGLATGIGIHTGEAVVGRIGSPRKKDYTAIGDTVNVAARVQGVAAGGEVLITGATLSRIEGKARTELIDPVALKGKSRAVAIHRVLSML
ncbi:MAG TPA: adenylate/guanylate cyclase domain-containing protein [bacterium]|nr:adenylate/guanylate cyclase domain-containing protein [bacterium]